MSVSRQIAVCEAWIVEYFSIGFIGVYLPDPEMLGLEPVLLTGLTTGLSGQGGSRSDSGSGWSMLVVSVLIKDLVKISVSAGQLMSQQCRRGVQAVRLAA